MLDSCRVMSMRIYLDCCCYNRPFDEVSQQRVQEEAAAVKSVLNSGECILGSDFLDMEIDMIKDVRKLDKVHRLYQLISEHVKATEAIFNRACELRGCSSLKNMDSLHIAAAEAGGAEIFLTVDDRLIRSCKGVPVHVKICNPVNFVRRYDHGGLEG